MESQGGGVEEHVCRDWQGEGRRRKGEWEGGGGKVIKETWICVFRDEKEKEKCLQRACMHYLTKYRNMAILINWKSLW